MKAFDLHAHVLPGIDDGAQTFEESIELLRSCHADGTRAVVATPHMFSPYCGTDSISQVQGVFDQTLEQLRSLESQRSEYGFLAEMEFFLGAENYLSSEFLKALDGNSVLSLGSGTYLLLEFGQYTGFETMVAAVKRVLDQGFVPVLAHIERYEPLRRRPVRIWELVDLGAAVQLNADSLVESKSSHKRFATPALSMLHEDLDVVIASDVHDRTRRRSRMSQAHGIVAERYSEQVADRWIWKRPRALVIGS